MKIRKTCFSSSRSLRNKKEAETSSTKFHVAGEEERAGGWEGQAVRRDIRCVWKSDLEFAHEQGGMGMREAEMKCLHTAGRGLTAVCGGGDAGKGCGRCLEPKGEGLMKGIKGCVLISKADSTLILGQTNN